jgi:putative two-component system hydrogenase maturation factor HypX/HoxX
MRILLLTHSFNCLTQRLHRELAGHGHDVSVEFDIHDDVTREAVALHRPDVILAPFLKRRVPDDVWRNTLTWIVHPGPPGDRGPAALDWAILKGAAEWGVTVLQAEAEYDAGPVWAAERFAMRPGTKSSLYRREVTEAALRAVRAALARFETGTYAAGRPPGKAQPSVTQADRRIDWAGDSTERILRTIRAADGQPGVEDELCGRRVYLYDAHGDAAVPGAAPGQILGWNEHGVCRATRDGSVWIGHVCPRDAAPDEPDFKLPAAHVLAEELERYPSRAGGPDPIRYEERAGIGFLYFGFYNGAMSARHCNRLREAFAAARQRPVKVICLMGGEDFWSNGLHLNAIEAAESPADASWENIVAMDDLVRTIVTTTSCLVLSAIRGNAGAGGVFLALAADVVIARDGVILNSHYKNMGNLYGSEYWTYLLPRRVGAEHARQIVERRLPMVAGEAERTGLIDACLPFDQFDDGLAEWTGRLCADHARRLETKRGRLVADEARRPLEAYRHDELTRMRLNFFGFDPSYHVARYYFVHKTRHSRTPPYLARHRTHAT